MTPLENERHKSLKSKCLRNFGISFAALSLRIFRCKQSFDLRLLCNGVRLCGSEIWGLHIRSRQPLVHQYRGDVSRHI
jgi:hypothetical protein